MSDLSPVFKVDDILTLIDGITASELWVLGGNN
jgi:hypothetical protein